MPLSPLATGLPMAPRHPGVGARQLGSWSGDLASEDGSFTVSKNTLPFTIVDTDTLLFCLLLQEFEFQETLGKLTPAPLQVDLLLLLDQPLILWLRLC